MTTEEIELWIDVIGFKTLYQISNYGRLKEMNRILPRKGRNKTKTEYFNKTGGIRKNQKCKSGYLVGNMTKDGVSKHYYIHRLVAIHFIQNNENYPIVNHKDHDRANPFWGNLEWGTQKMNINHAIKFNRMLVGSKNGISKLTESDIPIIRKMISEGYTQKVIAEKFKVDQSNISYINTNKKWKHI